MSTYQTTVIGPYTPVPPLVQMRGTDPSSGLVFLYQLDTNGIIVGRWDDASKSWQDFRTYGPFARPEDLGPALSQAEVMDGLEGLKQDGLLTNTTEYLRIGDEIGLGAQYTVDLSASLGANEYQKLRELLKDMPRQILRSWFDAMILSKMPPSSFGNKKTGEDLIWMAFVNLFNEVNIIHCNSKNIAPWDWETQKLEAYLKSQNKSEIQRLEEDFKKYQGLVSERGREILVQYAQLPKIKDLGLEITRQASIVEMLKRGDYLSAQAVVDAYRYVDQTIVGRAVKEPIPFDVALEDGEIVQKSNQTSS